MEEQDRSEPTTWWGQFELAAEEVARWQVGPTSLWLYRLRQEWRMVYTQIQDPMDDRVAVERPAALEEMQAVIDDRSENSTVHRFPFQQTAAPVGVYPALADRPVVVQPETPLYLLPNESTRLYVSTPLWVGVEVGRQPRLLQEIPSFRPSDTWFGPSSREGELCYATRTSGRVGLEALPRRLHRAITPVHVRNRGADTMLLDRVQLPVQYLTLYQADNNFLWTQAVTLQRQEESDFASVRLSDGAPKEAAGGTRIRDPRLQSRENLIMRTFGAFSSLFN